MTPTLLAEPPTRRGGRWTIRLGLEAEQVNPDNGEQVRRVARVLGVEPTDIRQAVADARAAQEAEAEEPEPAGAEPVYGWTGSGETAQYEGLAAAIESGAEYLRWEGTGLCAVDVDVEAGAGWADAQVEALIRRPTATPAWLWRSRGGGVRAIFEPGARYGLSALERAGLWVLTQGDICAAPGLDKVELVRVTRRPPGPYWRGLGEYGANDMRGALLRTGGLDAVGPADADTWLAEHGLTMGGRYGHDRCPGPDPRATSGNDPVRVVEDGVMCYRCQHLYPWARLVAPDRETADRIPDAAQHLAHWVHARHVIASERPRTDPRFLRAGYAAMLRILHHENWEDEKFQRRVGLVWSPDKAYIRAGGVWLRDRDYTIHHPFSRSSVVTLPWVGGNSDRADIAESDSLLPGYTPVEPVLHLVDHPTPRADTVLIPHYIHSAPALFEASLDEARAVIRSALPGVTDQWLNSLYILVVAGLRAQLRLSQPAIVLLTGGSGAGKGALVAAASGILGTPTAYLRLDGQREFAMSIGQGLESRAALLLADEVGKSESWWSHSKAILAITSVHAWRKLHHGDCRTPVRAAIVLAGSTLPSGVLTQPEMVRRAVVIELAGLSMAATANWGEGVRRHLEVGVLEEMRQSETGASVAEAFVRAARLEVLRDPLPAWVDQAEALGAAKLTSTADMEELTRVARALYAVWTDGPEACILPGPRRRGWLRCWREGSGDEGAAALADWVDDDASRPERYARLQTLQTVALPGGVTLRIDDTGRRAAARFEAPGSRSLDRHDRDLFPTEDV